MNCRLIVCISTQVLVLCVDGKLAYWEITSGEEIRSIQVEPHGEATALAVDDSGESVAVGAKDSLVKVWRYRRGDLARLAAADCGKVSTVAFAPGGRRLAAATTDGAIITWATPPMSL